MDIHQIGTAVAQTLVAEAVFVEGSLLATPAGLLLTTASPGETNTATPSVTPTPTVTTTPNATPTPSSTLPPPAGASCIPQSTQRDIAQVTTIVDGDTIRARIGGTNFTVRYIGMDTPETGTPYNLQATNRNSQLVSGKTVILVKDVSETDRYDRILRYVLADGVFVNYQLVLEGLAVLMM